MTEQPHPGTLEARHAALELEINEEIQHLHPDDLLLQQLKRRKLRIKDEIIRLAVCPGPSSAL